MADQAQQTVNVDVSKISQGGASRSGVVPSLAPIEHMFNILDASTKARNQNDAIDLVNEKSLAFMAMQADITKNPELNPSKKGEAYLKLAQTFISKDDEAVLRLTPEARKMYKQHMASVVLPRTEQLMSHQIQADVVLQQTRFTNGMETQMRDAASIPEGDARLPNAIRALSEGWDNAPQGIGLDPVAGKRKAFDTLALARAENKAMTDPTETLKALGTESGLSIQLDGRDYPIHKIDPMAHQRLAQIAHGELSNRAAQNERVRVQELHTTTTMIQKTYDDAAIRIASGELGAYDELVGAAKYATNFGHTSPISGEKLNSLREQRDLKAKSIEQGGPTHLPELARVSDDIESGKIKDSRQIWGNPLIQGDDQTALYKRFIQKQQSREDQSYNRFEKDQKEAETYLKAWVNGKNPLSALGGVNSTGAQAVARYRVRIRAEEDKARAEGKGYDAIDPMNRAAQYIQETTKDTAESFTQDADAMLRSLSQFTPTHGPVTHEAIAKNIVASGRPQAEQNIMLGLLQQSMKQNGVLLETLVQNQKNEKKATQSTEIQYELVRRLAAGLLPKE